MYLNWCSIDTAHKYPQIWFTGRKAADPLNTVHPPTLTYQSNLPYLRLDTRYPVQNNFARWGDYSAITIDPLAPTRAWGVNENVVYDPMQWGIWIFRMNLP